MRRNGLFCVGLIMMGASCAAAERGTKDKSPAGAVRVMSFNIRFGTAADGEDRWEKRREMVFDVLRTHHPDVVGLQEALRFQIDEIRKALPEYGEVGVGRDDGKSRGEFSAILYRKDRLRPEETGNFWYSDTPAAPGSHHWGNHLPRMCTWAHFVPATSGGEDRLPAFYHFNTHLDHQSQPSRERSAEFLVQRIRQRSKPAPFVVTGDLNAGEKNPVIAYLTGRSKTASSTPADGVVTLKLLDTYRVLHPGAPESGTFNGFKGKRTGDKIDYIFVPEGTRTIDAVIIRDEKGGHYPSDHFPIMSTVVFEK